MPVLLHLDSSADLDRSRTRSITAAFADAWAGLGGDHRVVRRDLHRDPLPHLSDAALHWPPELRQAGSVPPAEDEARQARIIEELLGADVVLIGAPLYNYSMPSTLKTWIDHIHVPVTTASFAGSVPPMAGRHVVIATARGGAYDPGTPTEGWDHAVPPLQIVLGESLGMTTHVIATNVTLARDGEQLQRADRELDAARAAAVELARELG